MRNKPSSVRRKVVHVSYYTLASNICEIVCFISCDKKRKCNGINGTSSDSILSFHRGDTALRSNRGKRKRVRLSEEERPGSSSLWRRRALANLRSRRDFRRVAPRYQLRNLWPSTPEARRNALGGAKFDIENPKGFDADAEPFRRSYAVVNCETGMTALSRNVGTKIVGDGPLRHTKTCILSSRLGSK
jgi:hypothetical protein